MIRQELKNVSGVLVSWNINDIQLRKSEDSPDVTPETMGRALEINVKGDLWRLVAKTQEERDRFCCALQILQLYHSLQQQLESFSTPKKSEMEGYGQGGSLRPPTSSPATSLVSPFARAPAPPPTPQKLEFRGNDIGGL